ncbi:hypothetical protein EAH89_13610 [Roseomonas nepalensis]|uniref:Uncharacterized protein n=1 Tax=Muricoccus nepalensis TaxID=1854500 RepID=A0A502G421_9PROT|nr:hypothetical protein [Roseomonas nepalensis]TPG55966.1 hypothetical protein EAH89_13610 [Roseomonas nepalensis]
MTHLTGTEANALGYKVDGLAACSFTRDFVCEGDRILSLLWSKGMTLDAKYHADIRLRGAAEARGDLAACERIELQLATLTQQYAELIADLRAVRNFSHVGLSLTAQLLSHLMVQAREEPCEALLELIFTFSERVLTTYGKVDDTVESRASSVEQSLSDEQGLAATVIAALKIRQAEIFAHMAEAGDADLASAESIETRFRDSGGHLNRQMAMLADGEVRTRADVVALASVVSFLVQNGVGAEGYGFMLPLCCQLCDVLVAEGGDLPS